MEKWRGFILLLCLRVVFAEALGFFDGRSELYMVWRMMGFPPFCIACGMVDGLTEFDNEVV